MPKGFFLRGKSKIHSISSSYSNKVCLHNYYDSLSMYRFAAIAAVAPSPAAVMS